MVKYIIKQILWMIPVIIGIIFIIFTINRFTPGDPVIALIGNNYTQEQYDAKRAELGLDEPFLTQFGIYFKGIVTEFDLGTSYQTGRPVNTEILERFPITLSLGIIGIIITVIAGIPTGIAAALRRNTAVDYIVTAVSMFFAAMPNFWMALMFIIIFSLKLKWLPASGIETWQGWILPALSLGLFSIASVTRMTRSSMLEVIRQDYIRTAKAKGLKKEVIIRKHALKNSLISVITVIGIQASMISWGDP